MTTSGSAGTAPVVVHALPPAPPPVRVSHSVPQEQSQDQLSKPDAIDGDDIDGEEYDGEPIDSCEIEFPCAAEQQQQVLHAPTQYQQTQEQHHGSMDTSVDDSSESADTLPNGFKADERPYPSSFITNKSRSFISDRDITQLIQDINEHIRSDATSPEAVKQLLILLQRPESQLRRSNVALRVFNLTRNIERGYIRGSVSAQDAMDCFMVWAMNKALRVCVHICCECV
jgi:hypothetical protein